MSDKYYSDDEISLDIVNNMLNKKCSILESANQPSLMVYYYCDCDDPDKKIPVCEYCILNCHKGHSYKKQKKAKVFCHCGLQNHFTLEPDRNEKNDHTTCHLQEICYYGNFNFYYHIPQKSLNICSFCNAFCSIYNYNQDIDICNINIKNLLNSKNTHTKKSRKIQFSEFNTLKTKTIDFYNISQLTSNKKCTSTNNLNKISSCSNLVKSELSDNIFEHTNKIIKISNLKKFDPIKVKIKDSNSYPKCNCNNPDHKDYKFNLNILSKIFIDKNFLNFENINNMSPVKLINIIFKQNNLRKTIYKALIDFINLVNSYNIELNDYILQIKSTIKFSLQSIIKLCKLNFTYYNNKINLGTYSDISSFNFYNYDIASCFNQQLVFKLMNKNINNENLDMWEFKELFYNCFRLIKLNRNINTFHNFTIIDVLNLSPISRYMLNYSIKDILLTDNSFSPNVIDNIISFFSKCLNDSKAKFNFILKIISSLKLYAKYYLLSLDQKIKICSEFEKLFGKFTKSLEKNNNNYNNNTLNNLSNDDKKSEYKSIVECIETLIFIATNYNDEKVIELLSYKYNNYKIKFQYSTYFHSDNELGRLLVKNSINILWYIRINTDCNNKIIKSIINYSSLLLSLIFNEDDFYLLSLQNSLKLQDMSVIINLHNNTLNFGLNFYFKTLKDRSFVLENTVKEFFNGDLTNSILIYHITEAINDFYYLTTRVVSACKQNKIKKLFDLNNRDFFKSNIEILLNDNLQISESFFLNQIQRQSKKLSSSLNTNNSDNNYSISKNISYEINEIQDKDKLKNDILNLNAVKSNIYNKLNNVSMLNDENLFNINNIINDNKYKLLKKSNNTLIDVKNIISNTNFLFVLSKYFLLFFKEPVKFIISKDNCYSKYTLILENILKIIYFSIENCALNCSIILCSNFVESLTSSSYEFVNKVLIIYLQCFKTLEKNNYKLFKTSCIIETLLDYYFYIYSYNAIDVYSQITSLLIILKILNSIYKSLPNNNTTKIEIIENLKTNLKKIYFRCNLMKYYKHKILIYNNSKRSSSRSSNSINLCDCVSEKSSQTISNKSILNNSSIIDQTKFDNLSNYKLMKNKKAYSLINLHTNKILKFKIDLISGLNLKLKKLAKSSLNINNTTKLMFKQMNSYKLNYKISNYKNKKLLSFKSYSSSNKFLKKKLFNKNYFFSCNNTNVEFKKRFFSYKNFCISNTLKNLYRLNLLSNKKINLKKDIYNNNNSVENINQEIKINKNKSNLKLSNKNNQAQIKESNKKLNLSNIMNNKDNDCSNSYFSNNNKLRDKSFLSIVDNNNVSKSIEKITNNELSISKSYFKTFVSEPKIKLQDKHINIFNTNASFIKLNYNNNNNEYSNTNQNNIINKFDSSDSNIGSKLINSIDKKVELLNCSENNDSVDSEDRNVNSKIKDSFYVFLYLINQIFDSNTSTEDDSFLKLIFKKTEVIELLQNNDLDLKFRTELMRYYRILYIDLPVDENRINSYMTAFLTNINDSNSRKHENILETERQNFIQNLIKVSILNSDFDKNYNEVYTILLNEINNFDSILKLFNHESPENLQSYIENAIILPTYVFLNITFSKMFVISGQEILDMHLFIVSILEFKKLIIENRSLIIRSDNEYIKVLNSNIVKEDNFNGVLDYNNINLSNLLEIVNDIKTMNSPKFKIFDIEYLYTIVKKHFNSMLKNTTSIKNMEIMFNKQYNKTKLNINSNSILNENIKNKHKLKTKKINTSKILIPKSVNKNSNIKHKISKENKLFSNKCSINNINSNNFVTRRRTLFKRNKEKQKDKEVTKIDNKKKSIKNTRISHNSVHYKVSLLNSIKKIKGKLLISKIKWLEQEYSNSKKSFENTAVNKILSEVNINFKVNYRNLIVKMLFQIHQSGDINNLSLENTFNILLCLLKNDTTNIQKEIINLIEEDKSQVNFELMAKQFFIKLLSIVFLEYNPSAVFLQNEYAMACMIIMIFKYLCEEHNNYFQDILVNSLNFELDINIDNYYNKSYLLNVLNNNVYSKNKLNEDLFIRLSMSFYNCLLIISNKLALLSSWINDESNFNIIKYNIKNKFKNNSIDMYSYAKTYDKDNINILNEKKNFKVLDNGDNIINNDILVNNSSNYYYVLFSLINDLLIEINQGNTEKNFSDLLKHNNNFDIIKSNNHYKISNFNTMYKNDLITLTPFSLYVKTVATIILSCSLDTTIILVRQDLSNYILSFLEEKNVPLNIKMFLMSHFPANSIMKTLSYTLKSYYYCLFKSYTEALNSSKSFIKKIKLKSLDNTVQNNNNNSLNNNNYNNNKIEFKSIKSQKQKIFLLNKVLLDKEMAKFLEMNYFKSSDFSLSPEFRFSNSLFCFLKLSYLEYNFEDACNLINQLKAHEKIIDSLDLKDFETIEEHGYLLNEKELNFNKNNYNRNKANSKNLISNKNTLKKNQFFLKRLVYYFYNLFVVNYNKKFNINNTAIDNQKLNKINTQIFINYNSLNTDFKFSNNTINFNLIESYYIYKLLEKITRVIDIKIKDLNLKILFRIPYNINYLALESKDNFINHSNRDNRHSKLNSIIEYSEYFIKEIEYIELYLNKNIFFLIINKISFKTLDTISYLYIIVMNIYLLWIIELEFHQIYPDENISALAFKEEVNKDDLYIKEYFKYKEENIYYTVIIFITIHLSYNIICFVLWLWNKFPLYLNIDIDKKLKSLANNYEVEGVVNIKETNKKSLYYRFKLSLRIYIYYIESFLIHSKDILTIIGSIVSTLLGFIINKHSFMICFQTIFIVNKLDIIRKILLVIKLRSFQLISVFIFYVLISYIFGGYSYFYLNQIYFYEIKGIEYTCNTLFLCFIENIRASLRGGGIGDYTITISFLDNEFYMSRLLYISLYFILRFILLGLILGIILDAFKELRIKHQKALYDMKNVCFICGAQRDQLEQIGLDFNFHVSKKHNVWNYIYYIVFLCQSSKQDLNSINDYVYTQFENKKIGWFPEYNHKTEIIKIRKNTENKYNTFNNNNNMNSTNIIYNRKLSNIKKNISVGSDSNLNYNINDVSRIKVKVNYNFLNIREVNEINLNIVNRRIS